MPRYGTCHGENNLPRPTPLQAADILVSLLKSCSHKDVRRAALQTLPQLMRCSVLRVKKGEGGVDAKQVRPYTAPSRRTSPRPLLVRLSLI